MAGLAAARRRGRVGGRPTVMTAAKTKQATRMVIARTPLTEVADVGEDENAGMAAVTQPSTAVTQPV